MIASPERGFGAPPLWEIAVSAGTSGTLLDPYNVREVHDLFRRDLPHSERQAPITHLPVAAFVGGPAPSIEVNEGLLPRWWFLSEDGADLLQLQENFVACNWRRRSSAPGERFDYPGFDTVVSRYEERLYVLRQFFEAQGNDFPSPAACELLYNNIIPLEDENGERLPLSDVLAEYLRAEERPVLGFSMQWMEAIDGLASEDPSILQIDLQVVGVALPEREPLPVVRLQFVAGAVRETWEEVFAFYQAAHAHIRHRLMVLTTEKAHQRWLPK
ncbi:MAG TPA: TIGR04255 family protein [Allosphingosinicella sp.]|jgi:uncharacterized protein (TIGR04255 family)